MTDYTRISVAGTARRVEVVVPDDEPLGAVLPQLITLLDEPQGTIARPHALVAVGGRPLDVARTPREQELLDGAMLRLVPLDAAPPPPVVIDLTDAVSEAHDTHPARWDDTARLAAAGVGVAAAGAAGGLVLPGTPGLTHVTIMTALLILSALVAFAFGTARRPRGGLLAAAFGAGLSVPIGVGVAGLMTRGPEWAVALTGVLAAASAVLLIGVGAGRRDAAAAAGGAIGMVLGGVLLALLAAGVPVAGSAGIVVTAAVFVIGSLPWTALSTAGLTGLDEDAGDGGIAAGHARTAVDTAYRTLTWGVAVSASAVAIAGALLVLAGDLWSALLALAAAVAVALRSRSFPLRGQGWMLWAAVAVIGVAAIVHTGAEQPWWAVAGAAASVVVIAVAALVSPRPPQRARLRSLGNTLEMLAVVALIPLILGAFGVYAELLGLFGGGA